MVLPSKVSFKGSPLPTNLLQSLRLGMFMPRFAFQPCLHSTATWTTAPPCRLPTARIFPRKLFTSLPPNLLKLLPVPWMLCLLHLQQTLWRAGGGGLSDRKIARLGTMHHRTSYIVHLGDLSHQEGIPTLTQNKCSFIFQDDLLKH